MKRSYKKKKQKTNHLHQIPGQVVYVGGNDLPFSVDIIDYNSTQFTHKQTTDYKEIFPYRDTDTVTWINVSGLSYIDDITQIGQYFGLHALIIEDIVNTRQRPKLEEFETGMLLVLKILAHNAGGSLSKDHIAIVLGKNYVLTFQDSALGGFAGVQKRIKLANGRIRNQEADYLMYAILDVIVDDYFIVANTLSDRAEALEEELFSKKPRDSITEDIRDIKRQIMSVRKAVQPLRENIKQLEKTQHPLIYRKTRNYLRDLSDHTIQVSENIETYREIIWSLMELYMATVNNRMNEVMKVLTIMASIFIPLTFIAGVYGMNFDYMPELKYKWAYFITLGVMLILVLGMLWYFKRKKWL